MNENLGPNLDQLVAPTEATLSQFDDGIRSIAELGERYDQVSTTTSRGTEAILGHPEGKTIVEIGCGIYESSRPGEGHTAKNGLRVSILRWPRLEPGEVVHLEDPAIREIRAGKVGADMDDEQYAYAMQDLQTELPPKSLAWVQKAIEQASGPHDPAFEAFSINDLLDQAPSDEELIGNAGVTVENVDHYAVNVLESHTKSVQLSCNNGSQLTAYSQEANATYWRQNPDKPTLNVQVETADGRRYMYLRFNDGSERLTVTVPKHGDTQIGDSLRESGATFVEKIEDLAYGDNVRRGVQSPNDITMQQMTAEISAAVTSGIVVH